MRKFSVERKFDVNPQKSERVTAVMRMFGVGIDRLRDQQTTHACAIEVNDGDIVYITGPSGAGKSVLLREMQLAVADDERINIDEIELPADKAAIDCIGFTAETAENAEKKQNNSFSATSACSVASLTTIEVMSMLGYAGLSDVFCMLNSPANLSEGQKYRFRLAAAMALIEGENPQDTRSEATGLFRKPGSLLVRKYIFADEFCSNLDRITAAVIAYNVRRFAKRNGVTFFLASSHEDILADLQPDVLVVKRLNGEAEVTYKTVARRSSFAIAMEDRS